MPKLSYRDRQGVPRELQLGERTSIGRHPSQTIQLLDRVVSKEHAAVERLPDGSFIVRDGGSRNGTFLNGDRVEGTRVLSDGDKLTIGSTDLFFHQERPLARPLTERITIHAGSELDTYIRARAQQESGQFLPESQIQDTLLLRRDYEKLRIAHELSQTIGPEMDLERLLRKILDKAFEIFPADRGVILLGPDGGSDNPDTLIPMVARSRQGDADLDTVRISKTILAELLIEKQAVLSSDAMMDSRFNRSHSIVMEQIRSTMSVPLLHDERVLGAIHLDSRMARGAFTEKDLQILGGFGRQAAVMLEHHRVLKKMREEILVRENLHRLLSPQLVEEVVKGRIRLERGGQLRKATVLFADVRGFTTLSEKLSPPEVVSLLNEYFELMVDVIFTYEGTLDKFVGDEIMAIWGAPVEHPDDARRAALAAVEMQRVVHLLNAERAARGEREIQIGIGLNTGEVVAGYMGSTKSMNYTVMGDTVNTAARFCSAAGPGEVLIGAETFASSRHDIDAELLPPTQLKGKIEHVDIYRVIGLKEVPVEEPAPGASASPEAEELEIIELLEVEEDATMMQSRDAIRDLLD